MSRNIGDFPSVTSKLSVPSKKSVFEKQREEAEAKRLKEQRETAAVYADFVKSFENEDDDGGQFNGGRTVKPESGGAASGKRHFNNNFSSIGKSGFGGTRASGPGSLGPTPASLSRKRTHEGSSVSSSKASALGFEDDASSEIPQAALRSNAFETTQDVKSKEAERAAAKPTLHLSNLPILLGSSVIKKIIPENLTIEGVRLIPQTASNGTDRKAGSAIVTLSADTPASDIDAAVSSLQRKYLGWGNYLNISRHLSSAAVGSGLQALYSSNSQLPFGAKQAMKTSTSRLSRAPPPQGMGRAYAPPSSYEPSAYGRNNLQVEVKPPSDLRQLKLIHKMVESVIKHGPEFEALLMSRPSVQREERWAWLWDARSQGGVWYRWRLWEILTGTVRRPTQRRGPQRDSSNIIFDEGVAWQPQERAIAFEYSTKVSDFVSDSDYDSSDDEDSGGEGRQRLQKLQGGKIPQGEAEADDDAPNYLNPFRKAKLVHLLARLPTTTAKLRRGDVARLTAFAIRNASEGADEVVELITTNVQQPFALTSANPDWKTDAENKKDEENEGAGQDDSQDISSMKLIGLYIISDILSSSSTSGVRHAWRYRQLFEAALTRHAIFAHLGRLERELGWGRLRAEKFRRSVNGVLRLWDGWCAFSAGASEEFTRLFNDPPLTESEQQAAAKREAEQDEYRKRTTSRWRTVDTEGQNYRASPGDEQGIGKQTVLASALAAEEMDVDEDLDGQPMPADDDVGLNNEDSDENLDGEPMEEDDDDDDEDGEGQEEEEKKEERQIQDDVGNKNDNKNGEPMLEGSNDFANTKNPLTVDGGASAGMNINANVNATEAMQQQQQQQRRYQRPRAQDMFADND